jgi:N-acetylmuramoyl-L-alanine amidase
LIQTSGDMTAYRCSIVLSITQQVAANLERFGVQTVLTRRDRPEIDLDPRVQERRTSQC